MDIPGLFSKALAKESTVMTSLKMASKSGDRFHNCIIFWGWGLVTHIAYLPLFWDVKAIKMIVFKRVISAALVHAQIAVTEGGACARFK
jgi:hypothetical protein